MTEELPKGWAKIRLADVGHWYGGATPSKSKSEFWENGDIPWISPKDMRQEVLHEIKDRITEEAVESSPVRLVPGNSVVFVVRSGILERRFPVALTVEEATLNQDMKAIHPHEGVDSRWIAWSLRWLEQSILRDCRKAGTTVASLESVRIKEVEIPLPSLAEQRRIADALEVELSRLDAAERLLERAASRTLRTVAKFADFKIESHRRGDVRPLKNLLREPLRNGHSARASSDGGVRTLTLTAVTKGVFSNEYTKITSADPGRVGDLWVQNGDIFVQRSNTPDLVGSSALYGGEDGWAIFPDLLIRVRVKNFMDPGFVLRVLQSSGVRDFFRRSAKGLSGSMPKIDQGVIGEVMVPVLGLDEQRSIASEIDEYSFGVRRVHELLSKSRRRSVDLRNALLSAAFTGKLVPQDPSDEPASVLLERIRAERVAAPKAKRGRKAKTLGVKTSSVNLVPIPENAQPVSVGEQTALEF
ncbi:restriction endonuclease subunit S [Nocardiopsis flavescens]